ncbi:MULTISPECIES: hypothetical protein [Aequorivita]|uniref:Uncharacterized protein n=2 Tax=Aequorivita TaxID=153265 RepID=A0AB35YMC0_9FLAO|nr:hypothetical protein [Aequorivita sp. Ant34-E75]WGF91442.1 hypothetical protein QCQ61_09480 [Aequorivita sp. Ant34-E75]
MEQSEFLEKNIFVDLENLNNDDVDVHRFSEADFKIVLERVAYFGIGVYTIETWEQNKMHTTAAHTDFKKKATDPRWYNKAYLTFKTSQAELTYSATYKVSNKLLER